MNFLFQNYNKIINELITSINNDISNFKKKFEEKDFINQKNNLSQKAASLNENINKYRELYNKIKEKDLNFNILFEKYKKLEKKIKTEGNIFSKEDNIILFNINFQ